MTADQPTTNRPPKPAPPPAFAGIARKTLHPSWTLSVEILQPTEEGALYVAANILRSLGHVAELDPHDARVRRTHEPDRIGELVFCAILGEHQCPRPPGHLGKCGWDGLDQPAPPALPVPEPSEPISNWAMGTA